MASICHPFFGVKYRPLPQVARGKPVGYGQKWKEWIKFQIAKTCLMYIQCDIMNITAAAKQWFAHDV